MTAVGMEGNGVLADWGWDEGWAAAWGAAVATDAGLSGLTPARVTAQHRQRWTVIGDADERAATITGVLRRRAREGGLPVVGDWVGIVPSSQPGSATIGLVLPRRSAFVRRAAGPRAVPQVVASNVDTVLIATAVGHDLNARRLERYAAVARESAATPVVVLTKADLGVDLSVAGRLERDLGLPVVALSARTGMGLEALGQWIAPGRTIALVGSSGVGKSTLLNRLAGHELMATKAVREDDERGRHTTSHRELFLLPSGALLLDTPGMRELGLWEAAVGVAETFADIDGLARACRFRDCAHEREPGCAVRDAVDGGRLDERRLRAYRRLGAELSSAPTFSERLASDRAFRRAIRDAAAATIERKSYRER